MNIFITFGFGRRATGKNIDKLCKSIKINIKWLLHTLLRRKWLYRGILWRVIVIYMKLIFLNNDYLDIFTDLAKILRVNIFYVVLKA